MEGAPEPASLRTRAYVDGYNLYYGVLRGTPHKWLDPLRLIENILPSVLVEGDGRRPYKSTLLPCALKFFTAQILESAARDVDSVTCQKHYHNALRKTHKSRLEIIEGYYAQQPGKARLIDPEDPDKWPRYCEERTIWSLEEKQSDVNLAIHLVRDALLGDVDQVVVVTNDTDIAPALEMVRELTDVRVGVVAPIKPDGHPNTDLVKHAHWVKRRISPEDLFAAQLPRVVMGGKKPTIKPLSWFPRPDLLNAVIEICMPVFNGQNNKVWKWLLTPNDKYFDGRQPIDLCSDDAGFSEFLAYVEKWKNREGIS